MSKLTEEQERKLIDDFKNGMSVADCIVRYSVLLSEVQEIIRKELLRIEKEDGI